jgi:hypothetical protein
MCSIRLFVDAAWPDREVNSLYRASTVLDQAPTGVAPHAGNAENPRDTLSCHLKSASSMFKPNSLDTASVCRPDSYESQRDSTIIFCMRIHVRRMDVIILRSRSTQGRFKIWKWLTRTPDARSTSFLTASCAAEKRRVFGELAFLKVFMNIAQDE